DGLVVDGLGLDAVELPHAERGCLERPGAGHVAAEGEDAGEESVQRAELRRRALARLHVDFAVPVAVAEILVHGADARLPHRRAVAVAEEPRALQQVLVVRIDRAADVAGAAGPRSGLDVDLVADEADLRAPLVELHER